jgi:hypothetical protein
LGIVNREDEMSWRPPISDELDVQLNNAGMRRGCSSFRALERCIRIGLLLERIDRSPNTEVLIRVRLDGGAGERVVKWDDEDLFGKRNAQDVPIPGFVEG